MYSQWRSGRRGGRGRRSRTVRYADYSSIQKPLPPPPRGHVWHHDKDTREWKLIVATKEPKQLKPPLEQGLLNNNDDDNGEMTMLEHIVLPSDTFAGICLAYRIRGTQLRQGNCFSGSNLKLAPKILNIPVRRQDLQSGKIQIQNANSNACQQQAMLHAFPLLSPKEAQAYLAMADYDLEAATQQAHQDGVFASNQQSPIRHLMNSIRNTPRRGGRRRPTNTTGNESSMVVVAPMDLPAGFTFAIDLDFHKNTKEGAGKSVHHVRVPSGGVKEGETFTPILCCHPKSVDGKARGDGNFNDTAYYYPPAGEWKDDVCGCVERGLVAENCMGICCSPLLLGQVQTRNGLECCGQETRADSNTSHCFSAIHVWLLLVALWIGAHLAMLAVSIDADAILMAGWFLFLCLCLALTRCRIRQRFAIPGNVCGDVCCSVSCACCVVTQMARHTGNYRTAPAVCCSDSGLLKSRTQPTARIGKLKHKFLVSSQDLDYEMVLDDGGTVATADETLASVSSEMANDDCVIEMGSVIAGMNVIQEADQDDVEPLMIV